jgi:hypothetical protein
MRKTRECEKRRSFDRRSALIKVYLVFKYPACAEVAANALRRIKQRGNEHYRHHVKIVHTLVHSHTHKYERENARTYRNNIVYNAVYNKVGSRANDKTVLFRKHTANGNGEEQKQIGRNAGDYNINYSESNGAAENIADLSPKSLEIELAVFVHDKFFGREKVYAKHKSAKGKQGYRRAYGRPYYHRSRFCHQVAIHRHGKRKGKVTLIREERSIEAAHHKHENRNGANYHHHEEGYYKKDKSDNNYKSYDVDRVAEIKL